MENLNQAFFFVINKIIDMQSFFIKTAWHIGYITLLIAVFTAGLNYLLTAQGLKENLIKIAKATVFFFIIIFAYPQIIGFISSWTFDLASGSLLDSVKQNYDSTKSSIVNVLDEKQIKEWEHENYIQGVGDGYGARITERTIPGDPMLYFDDIIRRIERPTMTYYAIPPVSIFKIILIIAENCMEYKNGAGAFDFGRIIISLLCAFFIIFTGIFAVLEYLMAFLEFMLVASVGIILLPLSIWEGSKFMSEKFIGAIIGFFMKLLFCNIAIFLMLYGFITMAKQFVDVPFTGRVDQIISVGFICLLFLYICKSAPGIAQSLLTGTPSLSAAGAISAAGGAVAAAGATMSMVKKAGKLGKDIVTKTAKGTGKVLGGIGKAGLGIAGISAQADAASEAAKKAGGTEQDQGRAYRSSIGNSIKSSVANGLGLVRSLSNGGKDIEQFKDPNGLNKAYISGGIKGYMEARETRGAKIGTESMQKEYPYRQSLRPEEDRAEPPQT